MAAPLVSKLILRSGTLTHCTCGRISNYAVKYKCYPQLTNQTASFCTTLLLQNASKQRESDTIERGQMISQAMKAYLKRAEEFDAMMEHETREYEVGKRHLANIMGKDLESFAQEDIDKAIEYLLPSGLYEKTARPMLRHPEEIFPKRKEAAFSADGRPFHSMFYTNRPNFYQVLFEAGKKLDHLKQMFWDVPVSNLKPEEQIFLGGSVWVTKSALETMVDERLSDADYKKFLILMERLTKQVYCKYEEEFIFKYRKMLKTQSFLTVTKPVQYDSTGRAFQVAQGSRKKARAKVTVYKNGSGQFTINGQDLLSYFPHIFERQQLMFPLQFVDMLESVDVFADVEAGGPSGQAGAIRLAMSIALQSFVEPFVQEKMRLAGLLTRDPRVRERMKPGQQGARRKFTWKKR